MENELNIVTALLRHIRNDRRDITHRLPAEILATVVAYLDEESLIAATHVCRFWRSTLLSYSGLWAHPSFKNEQRALVFLERSKSAPVSIDLTEVPRLSEKVKEQLKEITTRLVALSAVHCPFLDELLNRHFQILTTLDVITYEGFPSVASLAPSNLRHLTKFCFKLSSLQGGFPVIPKIGERLLQVLRSCPRLEVAIFSYGNPDTDLEFPVGRAPTDAVFLPCLRSFTHESPSDTIHRDLFDGLSLPPTCNIAFTITDQDYKCLYEPWDRGYPDLGGKSYLSDIKTVKIAFQTHDQPYVMINTTFINSRRAMISLNSLTHSDVHVHSEAKVVEKILAFLGSSGMIDDVEGLHFDYCPALPPKGFYVCEPSDLNVQLDSEVTVTATDAPSQVRSDEAEVNT